MLFGQDVCLWLETGKHICFSIDPSRCLSIAMWIMPRLLQHSSALHAFSFSYELQLLKRSVASLSGLTAKVMIHDLAGIAPVGTSS